VILDANAGVAYIEPSVGVLARYQAQLLRTATHTRFHLEGTHLPVRTWDNRPIQLGGVATDWEAVSQVAQARRGTGVADQRWTARKHRGDGRTRWAASRCGLHLPDLAAHDSTYWERLLRASAELNLMLFVSRVDALQEAADSLAAAREALRTKHLPLGAVEVGLLADDALPETLEPLPCAVGWQVQEWTHLLAERLWLEQMVARSLGVRRVVMAPDAAPETLALALGLEPHTLIVPASDVPFAKTRLALLSAAECREWLLLRLRDWEDPALCAQLEQWLRERAE
jgi:hypothetical protein